MNQTKTLQTKDGETITYYTNGDSHKKPVIFIHGFPFTHTMWESQVKELQDYFYIISYDQRGAGKSTALQGPFTLEHLVDDLFEVINKEKLEKPNVVGFSMGGYVALRAFERQPESFSSLVLANTKSGADDNKAKLKRYGSVVLLKIKGLAGYADEFSKIAFSPKTFESNVDLIKKIKDMILANNQQDVIKTIFALLGRTDTTASLSQIKVPTLILVGDSDQITPLSVAQVLEAGITGSVLKIIPESGHMSPLENPKAFNESLKSFLI